MKLGCACVCVCVTERETERDAVGGGGYLAPGLKHRNSSDRDYLTTETRLKQGLLIVCVCVCVCV